MNTRALFAGIAVLAFLAGAALWFGSRAPGAPPRASAADITPAALYSAAFVDAEGRRQSLGAFQGRVVVLNFWATWCAPCREEMPGFVRLQEKWSGRGVQFLGLANDDPAKVRQFGAELRVNYPLWTGAEDVSDLSRRLGNRLGVLPHTVVLDREGRILESRIGLYPEAALNGLLGSVVIAP